jgi:hypothetical protein
MQKSTVTTSFSSVRIQLVAASAAGRTKLELAFEIMYTVRPMAIRHLGKLAVHFPSGNA